MKMLVLGIDGGDRRIINSLDMPVLQKLLRSGTCLDLEEDLWSRGWAEILSGVHGRDSGAFYNKPKLDGSHDFTQEFGTNDYIKKGIIPIWSKLTEKGYKVGFMNVPTTMPAPKVNGFFVSGAGSGYVGSGNAEIPNNACFPEEIKNGLYQNKYILDTRFMASGIKDATVFLNRLSEMISTRTNVFSEMCNKFKCDFGFVAYMGTQRIQYLAMSEIDVLMANSGMPSNGLQLGLVKLYKHMDDCVKLLLEDLNPKHIIIVSDHGAAPYLTSVNMDVFLRSSGFQQKQITVATTRNLLKRIARFVPSGIKQSLKGKAPHVAKSINRKDIDWNNSVAFGARYVSGVYINDNSRFGGPVMSESEVNRLVQNIVKQFNKTEEAKKYNLSARLYRQLYKNSSCSRLLPDIWIDHPDTVFFEGQGQFIEQNRNYGTIEALRPVNRDMFTGIKGRKPLLCIDKDTGKYIESGDPTDLTITYKIIERVME